MNSIRPWLYAAMVLSFSALFAQDVLGYTPAFTRNGNLLRWNLSEQPQGQPNIIEQKVEFFINRMGTVDLNDNGDGTGGEFDIVKSAFGAWQAQPSSCIAFNDLKVTDQTLIAGYDETNVILFDETNTTGFFPEGTGVIALTLTTYEDEEFDGVFDGRVRDTDLVFNGRDFTFSSGLEAGEINLKAVAVHEIGHICGLDHSFHQKTDTDDDSVIYPTMYPYLNYADDQVVSLEQDDISGLVELYPQNDYVQKYLGSISGKAQLHDEPVPGVDVIAYREDYPVVSAITLEDGTFRIQGVPPGTYTLRADSLSAANVYATLPLFTAFHSQYSIVEGGVAGLSSDASTVTVVAGKRHPSQTFSLVSSASPDFFEPNDVANKATQLAADGSAMLHQSWYKGDVDWVCFQGTKGILYEVVTDNLSFNADPEMQLYASNRTTLLAENDDINRAKGNYAARIRYTPTTTGLFYIRLTDAHEGSGSNTSYELRVNEIGSAKLDSNTDGQINTLDLFALSRTWTPGGEDVKNGDTTPLSTGLLLDLIQILLR